MIKREKIFLAERFLGLENEPPGNILSFDHHDRNKPDFETRPSWRLAETN